MSRAPNMKDMRERLNTIRGEIAVLRGQEALLLEMMNEAPKEPAAKRAAKGSVKIRVLELLEKQGRSGLNAAKAVELSEAAGDVLDRESLARALADVHPLRQLRPLANQFDRQRRARRQLRKNHR